VVTFPTGRVVSQAAPTPAAPEAAVAAGRLATTGPPRDLTATGMVLALAGAVLLVLRRRARL